jgi:hypothetical protein
MVVEFRDGKIWRDTRYYADPFEPPAWRAQWVEPIEPPGADPVEAGADPAVDNPGPPLPG